MTLRVHRAKHDSAEAVPPKATQKYPTDIDYLRCGPGVRSWAIVRPFGSVQLASCGLVTLDHDDGGKLSSIPNPKAAPLREDYAATLLDPMPIEWLQRASTLLCPIIGEQRTREIIADERLPIVLRLVVKLDFMRCYQQDWELASHLYSSHVRRWIDILVVEGLPQRYREDADARAACDALDDHLTEEERHGYLAWSEEYRRRAAEDQKGYDALMADREVNIGLEIQAEAERLAKQSAVKQLAAPLVSRLTRDYVRLYRRAMVGDAAHATSATDEGGS